MSKWDDGAWRDDDGRPVCVRCERILSGHYTICVHCKTQLSRSQMDAADKWERWNKVRFDRAAVEQDQDKRAAILKETYRFTHEINRPPAAVEYWLVKIRFIAFDDQGGQQPKVIALRAEDKLGLTFLQIASLKLQASILETIPVTRESEQR